MFYLFQFTMLWANFFIIMMFNMVDKKEGFFLHVGTL